MELKAGIEHRESYVSRYEKKLKDNLDDEVQLVGLEALVSEELEMFNSNRLRTFEDARLEIVTYVEAKFGLEIRDPKPSGTGALLVVCKSRGSRSHWRLSRLCSAGIARKSDKTTQQ